MSILGWPLSVWPRRTFQNFDRLSSTGKPQSSPLAQRDRAQTTARCLRCRVRHGREHDLTELVLLAQLTRTKAIRMTAAVSRPQKSVGRSHQLRHHVFVTPDHKFRKPPSMVNTVKRPAEGSNGGDLTFEMFIRGPMYCCDRYMRLKSIIQG